MRRLYPGGKEKAFNISYDDGVLQDVPFVEMLNYFGLKGTFNLNSGAMLEQYSWTHPCGMEVTRLPLEAAADLYKGHEIAGHTLNHPFLQDMPVEEILRQMGKDKQNLEQMSGGEVRGFAVPFSYHSELISRCARHCGFEYARISECTHDYDPWRLRYQWRPGIFHFEPELSGYVSGFLGCEQELALCQIVGHSYDLDAENLWGTMELICRAVSGREDVWSCTHLELVRYLHAIGTSMSAEGQIRNNSDLQLWFEVDGKIICLSPGEEL